MKRFDAFFNYILVPLDYLAVLTAFLIAYYYRDYLNQVFVMPWYSFLPLAAGLSLVWIISFAAVQLYSFTSRKQGIEELLSIILGASAALTIASSLIFLLRNMEFSRLVLITTWSLSIILTFLVNSIVMGVKASFYRRGTGVKKVLLIGPPAKIHLILEGIRAQKDPGVWVAGYIGEHKEKMAGIRYLGNINKAWEVINEHKIDEIILAESRSVNEEDVNQIMTIAEEKGLTFKFVPDLYRTMVANIASYNLAGVPVVEVKRITVEGWFSVVKRIIDVVIATVAIILTSPIMLAAAIAIKLDSSGTIIFPHERVGRNGRKFMLYKFRSMNMIKINGSWHHAEENKAVERLKEQQKNYKLEHDPRVTRVGAFIRKTSIDELPQFFNVLKGEMSVVGPRAYIEKELERQQVEYPQAKELVRRLLMVKPGVTGIWQVSGRSKIEFSERVAMDAYYATHASLWMDIKIVLQTVPVVVRGSGAM